MEIKQEAVCAVVKVNKAAEVLRNHLAQGACNFGVRKSAARYVVAG